MAQKETYVRNATLVLVAAIAGVFLFAHAANAATLYIVPRSATESVGHSFTAQIDVSSLDQAMNAAQGVVSFPTDLLEVVSISKANSIMTLWVQDPSFSNRDGVINFQGVVVNPGFLGSAGTILTVTFRVKDTGTASVNFLSGSVLANDGKGTNILSGLTGATYSLRVAPPTSPSAATTPTSALAAAAALAAKDNTPPEPFIITRRDEDLTDTEPVFTWATTDGGSGLSHYEAKIGEGDWFIPQTLGQTSRYVLPEQSPTTGRTLTVRAYDNAGNFRASNITFVVIPATGWRALVYHTQEALALWGWLLALAAALFALLGCLALYNLLSWKKRVRVEMGGVTSELRHDLLRLQAELEEVQKGDTNRDQILEKETKRIKDNIGEDLKKIEKL